jgi:hypothetical protein
MEGETNTQAGRAGAKPPGGGPGQPRAPRGAHPCRMGDGIPNGNPPQRHTGVPPPWAPSPSPAPTPSPPAPPALNLPPRPPSPAPPHPCPHRSMRCPSSSCAASRSAASPQSAPRCRPRPPSGERRGAAARALDGSAAAPAVACIAAAAGGRLGREPRPRPCGFPPSPTPTMHPHHAPPPRTPRVPRPLPPQLLPHLEDAQVLRVVLVSGRGRDGDVGAARAVVVDEVSKVHAVPWGEVGGCMRVG